MDNWCSVMLPRQNRLHVAVKLLLLVKMAIVVCVFEGRCCQQSLALRLGTPRFFIDDPINHHWFESTDAQHYKLAHLHLVGKRVEFQNDEEISQHSWNKLMDDDD